MKFGSASRWRNRPSPFPEWVTLAAPTVAAVAGTSLVGVLPAVIVSGTRHMTLLAVAAGVPLVLLLLMAGFLALLLPREAGPSGGGGWPPPPADDPPDEPPWWPSFEEAFRQHAREHRHAPAGTPPGGGDQRALVAPVPPAAQGKRG